MYDLFCFVNVLVSLELKYLAAIKIDVTFIFNRAICKPIVPDYLIDMNCQGLELIKGRIARLRSMVKLVIVAGRDTCGLVDVRDA